MELEKIQFEDLETKAVEFIKQRKSFQVWGLDQRMLIAVAFLEKAMSCACLTSRVYSSKRALSLLGLATPWTFPIGILSGIGIIAHNLATYDPDYEIAKYNVDKVLIVTYKR